MIPCDKTSLTFSAPLAQIDPLSFNLLSEHYEIEVRIHFECYLIISRSRIIGRARSAIRAANSRWDMRRFCWMCSGKPGDSHQQRCQRDVLMIDIDIFLDIDTSVSNMCRPGSYRRDVWTSFSIENTYLLMNVDHKYSPSNQGIYLSLISHPRTHSLSWKSGYVCV